MLLPTLDCIMNMLHSSPCSIPFTFTLTPFFPSHPYAVHALSVTLLSSRLPPLLFGFCCSSTALSYARRVQFGQPIADFQGMQFQYAEAAIHIEAARTMMYNAARMKQAGLLFYLLLQPFLNTFRASGRERSSNVQVPGDDGG